jgi:very-short-patch-repair endonuclease
MPTVPYVRNTTPLKPISNYEADFLLDGWLVVEIQGGVHVKSGHSTGTGIERDMKKLATFAQFGYLVLQFGSTMIRSGEAIAATKLVYERWLQGVPRRWQPRRA